MSYLRGSKRLKVIQQYLAGNEDPNWDVYPSRTEGKYIVRPKKAPAEGAPSDETHDETPDAPAEEPVPDEVHTEPVPEEPVVKAPAKPTTKAPTKTAPKAPVVKAPSKTTAFDPTVSLEILTQLKSLGEELRLEREAKHQKKLIKQTVRDQMYKVPRYIPQPPPQQEPEPEYDEEEEEMPPPPANPEPPRPMFVRRRLNLVNR